MRSLTMRAISFLAAVAWGGICYGQSVLTYHNDPGRSGRYVVPALDWARAPGVHLDKAFAPRFSGQLYAQPLYWQPPGAASGQLIVATGDNVVAAIDARSGKTLWSRSLGRPVPLSALACGDIDPLGITGTPVIDAHTATLYLDAMVGAPAGPQHRIFALSLKDGAVLPGWPVDVGAALAAHGMRFDAAVQNQRGALAILGGRVFVPYGGHYGDCGDYHGWIVGIDLENPGKIVAWHTLAPKGGIWAPGGIAIDDGRLFFATGNTNAAGRWGEVKAVFRRLLSATNNSRGARRWGDGEAVFRLAPDLTRTDDARDYFAPADWGALDAEDADLGGSNPLPFDLPDGSGVKRLVLALGKDAHAYLLDRTNLGGIGGQLVAETVAEEPIRTAPAAYPDGGAIMVAFAGRGSDCPNPQASDALTVLKIAAGAPPSLATAWCGPLDGRGAPIVTTTDGHANPIVWMLGAEGDNRLHGFRGDTGAVLFAGGGPDERLRGLRHFGTLLATATGDRLYVGADGRLYAFAF